MNKIKTMNSIVFDENYKNNNTNRCYINDKEIHLQSRWINLRCKLQNIYCK